MTDRVDKASLPLNQPRRTPSHPTQSHIVKTKVDGKEKIIRFGEQGASTAGKPKAGESERMVAKRKSFKSRHAKNIAKGPSSAAYWANRVKWAAGGLVRAEPTGAALGAIARALNYTPATYADGGTVKAEEGYTASNWMDKLAGKYLGVTDDIDYAKRRPAELGLTGEVGGEADAMRHLLISKALREKYPRAAPWILGAREALTGFGEDRRLSRQDELNNALAAELMKTHQDQPSYEQRALQAIRSREANVPFPPKKRMARGGLARFKECNYG